MSARCCGPKPGRPRYRPDERGGRLVVGGKAHDFKEGVTLAAQSIDSGAAAAKLAGLITLSQRLANE